MRQQGFFAWFGGKSRLAKLIIPELNQYHHSCYVEVFAGAAHVFFQKNKAKAEIINDINNDIVNLYRVVQHQLDEFCQQFQWTLVSKQEFDRLRHLDPNTLSNIEKAFRFYYLQKLSFSGHIIYRSFKRNTNGTHSIPIKTIKHDLAFAHQRLAKTVIECETWQNIIKRYDREHTLFYLDPPYYQKEDFYGKGLFQREEYQQMADTLAHIQGNFVLSLNDLPQVRRIFKHFHMQNIQTNYSCGHNIHKKTFHELLITKK